MRGFGQLSLDLCLTIIFAMLFVEQLSIIWAQTNSSATEISITMQEKEIANNLASIITSAAALSDGKFSIEYTTPKIMEYSEFSPNTCTITINDNDITVSYEKTDGTVTEAKTSFLKPAGFAVPATAECGETITISKTT